MPICAAQYWRNYYMNSLTMMYAPVLISVYDRLSKLKELVNSLVSNKEAIETDLYIAIDFPYKKEDQNKHKAVIDFCKEISGFKSVNPIIREVNYGPYRNMREARLQLLNIYPYAISITDDHVVSPNFLEYMNKALKFYEEDDRIFAITGYNYPVQMPPEYKYSCYLWPGFNGYGNGWWKSKFDYSYLEFNNFRDFLSDKSKVTQFFNIANHILPIILAGLKKGISYGDAALRYNLFINNRYQLYPMISKTRNKGFDGSGVHCDVNNIYEKQRIDDGSGEIEFVRDIQPDKRIYEALSDHFRISKFAQISLERGLQEYIDAHNATIKKNQRQPKPGARTEEDISPSKSKEGAMVFSPLTGSMNVSLEREIPCKSIIQAYRQGFNIDVAGYFKGFDTIQVYKCLDSDFRFYYPMNLEGHSEFYEALQHFPWYYMDWKWENEVAEALIQPSDHVLEIGCGKGSFVEKLAGKGIRCIGLELNEDSTRKAQEKGLNILNEPLGVHIRRNLKQYDVVCSFQVMEHIASVQEFIQHSIIALKPGGKMLVSVPNHDSFIGLDWSNVLDMPPHHVGLWNEKALEKVADIFNIRLNKFYIEPLQSYHIDYYIGIMKRVIGNDLGLQQLMEGLARTSPEEIKGHSILAEYIS
jgi:SAM-dependent methyltransferase